MALKYLVLVITLFVLFSAIAFPMAQAQLLGGILGPLLGLFRIQGILYCTTNGGISVNGTATPVFPNALVQLQCAGNVVSSTTTNGSGLFSLLLDPVYFALSTVLSGCRLVVNTPLASCNASLPSIGGLESTLRLIGSSLLGVLNVANIIPSGFQFNANIRQ